MTNTTKIVGLNIKGEKLWEADMQGIGTRATGRLFVRSMGTGAQILPADNARLYLVAGLEMVTFNVKTGGKSTVKLDLSVLGKKGDEEDAGARGWVTVPGRAGLVMVQRHTGQVRSSGATGQSTWLTTTACSHSTASRVNAYGYFRRSMPLSSNP